MRSLGPLIHNPGVIADLEKRGVGVISDPDGGRRGHGHPRSHGVPREVKEQLAATDTVVVDATCRFVKSAQEKAAKLHRQGYLVIILGEKDHPEVLALRSYAGEDSLVVESPADLPDELSEPAGRCGGADHAVAGAPRRTGGVSGAAHARTARAQHHLQRHRAAADGGHGHGRPRSMPSSWWGAELGQHPAAGRAVRGAAAEDLPRGVGGRARSRVVPRAQGGGHHRRRLHAPRTDRGRRRQTGRRSEP